MTEVTQATICLLCAGTGLLHDHLGSSSPCERCSGTGIVWLRIIVEKVDA